MNNYIKIYLHICRQFLFVHLIVHLVKFASCIALCAALRESGNGILSLDWEWECTDFAEHLGRRERNNRLASCCGARACFGE